MMVLALNAGSSSLKFAVYDVPDRTRDPALVVAGQFAGLGGEVGFTARAADGAAICGSQTVQALPDAAAALDPALAWLEGRGFDAGNFAAVGHRIVHGGARFSEACVVDDRAAEDLERLAVLAPLHMPFGLGALRAVRVRLPHVPQIACFDTAFHATQPDIATRLPLPARYRDKGYRRYGFHGLNYRHVTEVLPRLADAPLPSRLLVLHLGNGASACAIRDGRSIATTMGYSPLDGLVMSTRAGAIDPGVLLALMRDEGLDVAALETLLYKRSGLLALSGRSSDMRTLLACEDASAKTAVASFCYWAARHAGSLIAALGGLDAVVFTGGIGENAAPVRTAIVEYFAWLGAKIDPSRNAAGGALLSPDGAAPSIWCVRADEEAMIARHVAHLLAA
ncbi:MAG: acetate/propionate family kinase [Hyphomicrobiaceae bacterium]